MKKYRLLLMVLLLSFLPLNNIAKAAQEDFRVIGYYSEGLFDEPIENLQMDKLTHIMYAFLIPQIDGSLVPIEKSEHLRQIVSFAHENGVKVFIALGGWSYQNMPVAQIFETVTADETSRSNFIDHIMTFVQDYDLDGVELDWEYPTVDSQSYYEALVVELSARLDEENKELSAALNGAWSSTEGPEVSKLVTPQCLEAFSFINIMCYDTNDTDHSPLWFTDTSISYWLNRGMKPEQIVVGIPLYARPSWAQYRHLVAADSNNAYRDFAAANEKITLDSYYNGLNTITEKTAIALRRAGGVMLFDVNEDTNDEYSAVGQIQAVINNAQKLGAEKFARKVLIFLDERPLVFAPKDDMGDAFIDENDRTMLPLRKPLQMIGAEVVYDAATGVITIIKDKTTVIVTIGSDVIMVNGEMVKEQGQAIVKDGRCYIPARAVFAAFGYQLDWHDVSKSLYLQKSIGE